MISETRQLLIKNKIISFDDVFKLATIAYEEYLKGKGDKDDYHSDFSLSALCDDSGFVSADISLVGENSPLRHKRPVKIEISARGVKPAKWTLEIELNQREGRYSSILITSHDSIWVNGFLSKFQDLISSFTPQNTLVANHLFSFWILTSIGLGYILHPILNGLVKLFAYPDPNHIPSQIELIFRKVPFLWYLFTHLSCVFVALGPAAWVVKPLKDLWPSVELAIGPEHTQIEKKRRNWILGFIGLVIIPIVVSILYDVLKFLTIGKS